MRLSEAEAKTKWCPMARAMGGRNREEPDTSYPVGKCIGSGCMMWVWSDAPDETSPAPRGSCGLAQGGYMGG